MKFAVRIINVTFHNQKVIYFSIRENSGAKHSVMLNKSFKNNSSLIYSISELNNIVQSNKNHKCQISVLIILSRMDVRKCKHNRNSNCKHQNDTTAITYTVFVVTARECSGEIMKFLDISETTAYGISIPLS